MNRENASRDKKLEHVEDLERMSRILKRRSEEAKAPKKKELDGPSPGSCDKTEAVSAGPDAAMPGAQRAPRAAI